MAMTSCKSGSSINDCSNSRINGFVSLMPSSNAAGSLCACVSLNFRSSLMCPAIRFSCFCIGDIVFFKFGDDLLPRRGSVVATILGEVGGRTVGEFGVDTDRTDRPPLFPDINVSLASLSTSGIDTVMEIGGKFKSSMS
jgi:hypothetical protein